MQNKLPKTTYSSSITTSITHEHMAKNKIIFYIKHIAKTLFCLLVKKSLYFYFLFFSSNAYFFHLFTK
jgi:hypothetical protein